MFPRVIIVLLVCFLMTGCLRSFNPFYSPQTLVSMPDLNGEWIDTENQDIWVFQPSGFSSFDVVLKKEKVSAKLIGNTMKLGAFTYIDLFPKDYEKGDFRNDFYKFHFLPVHTLSKIRVDGDRLELAMLDVRLLTSKIEAGTIDIEYTKIDEEYFLSGSTEKIQKFLLEITAEEKAFSDPTVLRRVKREPGQADSTTTSEPLPQAPVNTSKDARVILPTERRQLFEFHSNFWINLHHTLYQQAGLNERSRDSKEVNKVFTDAIYDKLKPGERRVWDTALSYYRANYTGRDLLFDNGMIEIKNALAHDEDTHKVKVAGLIEEFRVVLEQAAPIYREHWWPEHNRANQAWIKSVSPLIERFGGAIVEKLQAIYRESWPKRPVMLDVSYYSNWAGAYTTLRPLHIIVSSSNSTNQGLAALETAFHEASHGMMETVMETIAVESRAVGKKAPRTLWHALLFFTTGEIVRRELVAEGQAYLPYADLHGLYKETPNWPEYHQLLKQYWQPYIDGKAEFTAAIANIVK